MTIRLRQGPETRAYPRAGPSPPGPYCRFMWLSGSSWNDQPPWRTSYDPTIDTLAVLDPGGTHRARVTRIPQSDTGFAEPTAESGVATKLHGWFRRALDVDSLAPHRGRLREGQRAQLEIAGEPPQPVGNGRSGAWRRSRKGTSFVAAGRTYALRHVGRRRTELSRDGTAVALLRRRGWYWHRSCGDDPPRSGLRPLVALDQVDELAVTLGCSVFGPPGRPGAVSEFFSELSP